MTSIRFFLEMAGIALAVMIALFAVYAKLGEISVKKRNHLPHPPAAGSGS